MLSYYLLAEEALFHSPRGSGVLCLSQWLQTLEYHKFFPWTNHLLSCGEYDQALPRYLANLFDRVL